jgi:polysaccharide biosynthesis/export protein
MSPVLSATRIVLAIVIAGTLAACNLRATQGGIPDLALESPGPIPLTPVNMPPPGMPYLNATYPLDSGDRVRVTVFGQDNLSRVYPVDGSGHISLPLIGPVLARGCTTVELANTIKERLQRQYIKDPKVTVEVDAYRPFFILGEVRRPGQFPYVNGMTVETAVAIAEGYTERANQRMVRITRKTGPVMNTTRVPTDYPVMPGDTIYVLERFF